jgi:diketogulonate reductase-like aldo/keto reductase
MPEPAPIPNLFYVTLIAGAAALGGLKVSLVGVGGAHIGRVAEKESIAIVRGALDRGINFLDNSWDYNDGKSEEWMGKALKDGYRQKAFLMTKIDGRTRASAAQQLDESLKRLQVDHIDLLQFHEIIRMNDADRIFAPGGALEAVLEAKKAGKVRYVGFTGHKSPDIHLHMLKTAADHKFEFDTVQMPLNVMDAHYDSFETKVLPVALQRKIAVLAMKPMGDHIILDSKTVAPVDCLPRERTDGLPGGGGQPGGGAHPGRRGHPAGRRRGRRREVPGSHPQPLPGRRQPDPGSRGRVGGGGVGDGWGGGGAVGVCAPEMPGMNTGALIHKFQSHA